MTQLSKQSAIECASTIDWHPGVETLPGDRQDGREVLLWHEAGYPVLCSWDQGWRDPVGREVVGATHWADVGGPGV